MTQWKLHGRYCDCSSIGASDSLRQSRHFAHAARDGLLIAGAVKRPKQKRSQNRRQLDPQEEVMYEDVDLDAHEMVMHPPHCTLFEAPLSMQMSSCTLVSAVTAQSELAPAPKRNLSQGILPGTSAVP